jgi:hypothetical protein
MNDIDVVNAVDQFYKLKSEYEKSIYNDKMKIINNNILSKEDKLKKYKLIKHKCINCKKDVGTIFTTNNNKLSARCGATKSIFNKNFTPCPLDILIEKGNINLLPSIINEFHREKETDKDEIIKTKLNYFFNFENEDNTIQNFKELKKNYLEDMETYADYLSEFNDTVNNIENQKEIDKTILDINASKELIKEMIKEYKQGGNDHLLKDTVTEYIDVLQSLINKYNTLKYNYYTIETNKDKDKGDTHTLQKKIYTTKDVEITIDATYKIISNKK